MGISVFNQSGFHRTGFSPFIFIVFHYYIHCFFWKRHPFEKLEREKAISNFIAQKKKDMNWARLSWHLCLDSVRSQDSLSPRRRHIPRDDMCCILIMVCLCKNMRENLQHNAFPKFSSRKSDDHWLENYYITSCALFDCTCSGISYISLGAYLWCD